MKLSSVCQHTFKWLGLQWIQVAKIHYIVRLFTICVEGLMLRNYIYIWVNEFGLSAEWWHENLPVIVAFLVVVVVAFVVIIISATIIVNFIYIMTTSIISKWWKNSTLANTTIIVRTLSSTRCSMFITMRNVKLCSKANADCNRPIKRSSEKKNKR